jgi:hypothetical protein
MRVSTASALLFAAVLVVAAPCPASAQAPAGLPELTVETSPSPELIGTMTKELGVTPKQAVGGTGALLGLAKSRMKADEFGQVASAIPGTDALLKAAPAAGGMGAMAGMGGMGGAAGLASLAGGFKSLGMSPDMAAKMVPVLGKYVESKGSAAAAKALMGALK